ncbi:MAG TPA: PEPxxWA-CTERM sorting domain-containing protein [Caulobacteraceae bacterium]|jgi:hypothetical protein|nr:PEPxxWA-CTERM sorting domain-containing protein [Caulobacteraceae bacterium]
MERDYSLASVLGGAAGITAVIVIATLALAAPRLGDVGPTDWGKAGHSPSLPVVSDDNGGAHVPKADGCGGVPCYGPLSGLGSWGDLFANNMNQGLGADLSFGDGLDAQRRFHDDRGHQAGMPEVLDSPFQEDRLFTGLEGIPSGFLSKIPPTVTETPPSAPVPEPAVWALLLLGLGVVGADLRARRRASRTLFS